MRKTNSSSNKEKGADASQKKDLSKHVSGLAAKFRNEISSNSYEEAIQKVDILLEKLQADNIKIEEIQENYLKGKIYIEHCEKLLNEIEQSVSEINLDDI